MAIDVEIIETPIIELKQAPVIIYDLIEAKGGEVQEKINSLNIDMIEATEANLAEIKSIRADLNKDFKHYEEQRKLIKDLIMKPYNDFEASYKKNIALAFNDADVKLKNKANSIETGLLLNKTNAIVEYFNEINSFDFIKFEDLQLQITRSKSNKIIKSEIEEYLLGVQKDLATIETIENSDRILAKYQLYKDLNRAISETNIELNREKAIQEAKKIDKQEEVVEPQKIQTEEPTPQQFRVVFEVVGTIKQIKSLKEYMRTNNIHFEGIK